jgi:uracil-DNA glycosylase
MSDEVRKEAAGVARSVRRWLEREGAAGRGELAARAVGAAARGRAGAREGAAGAAARADAGRAAASAAPARSAPVARVAEPATHEITLHPIDPIARAAIAAEAEVALAAIAGEVRACERCALSKTRNQAVPGVGSALSGIVFVGEAPGAEEDRLGEPFVGRGGQLLDRIIKAVDEAHLIPGVVLDRSTIFIGNVIHCRPPENRVPLPFEVDQSSPFLRRQIEALRPRIVCCLGKTAAEHMLGAKASLASMRGKVHRFAGAKLIVTYHPAAVLRNPELKRPVWEDMHLLAREYQSD